MGAVRALLEFGAAVDSPDGSGMPMAYALTFGFTDIAELLERAGAQFDMRFAAGLDRLEIVKTFVNPDGSLKSDAGRLADPYENRFRCERTRQNILCQALAFACQNAQLETAEYLLELGADPNQEVPGLNQPSGTVLHALTVGVPFGASRDAHDLDHRRIPVIALPLRHGASVTLQDSRFHSTPLGWAAHHQSRQIFDVLTPHAGIHDAVRFGLEARLDEILASNPSLATVPDALGQTPLDIARTLERHGLVERLRAYASG
jgi:ankyrin repeat protein